MEVNANDVGARIRQIRKNMGLSMTEFANRLNVLEQSSKIRSGTVSNWETGKNLPNNNRLTIISGLANIPLNELLYGSFPSFARVVLNDVLSQKDVVYSDRDVLFILVEASKEFRAENLSFNDENRIREIFDKVIIQRDITSKNKVVTILRDSFYDLVTDYSYNFFESGQELIEKQNEDGTVTLSFEYDPFYSEKPLKKGIDIQLYVDLLELVVEMDEKTVEFAKKYELAYEVSPNVQTFYEDEMRTLIEKGYIEE